MLAVLAALFVLSGAAGLFYEAVWSRYLSLFVGHDAYAQILTLVIFLGGMGLGALIVSRRSSRIKDPLFAYAIVEAVIGVLGLAFHDVIYLPATSFAYEHLFPGLGGGVPVVAAKWALAGLLILPQSMLLGATFPLMTAGAIRRMPAHPGRTLSVLYFTNSLGAAIGVLVAGFVLFDMAGLPGTLAAASMLNLVVALGALIVVRYGRTDGESVSRYAGKSVDASPTDQPPPTDLPTYRPTDLPPPQLARLLLLLAAGTAIASFVYEVGWIRMLSLVLGSSTHSFELMLSAFILGLSLGAWWMRKRADRFADPLRALAVIQLAMGALAIASLPLYLETFDWSAALLSGVARSDSGYLLYTLARYGMCLAVMLPATFCAGMTLPLMTRMLMGGAGERAIGAIYGANTLGSIVGAAATGLILLPVFGLKGTLLGGGLLDVALGLMVLAALARAGQPVRRLAIAGAGGVAVALLVVLLVRFDQGLLSSGVFRIGRIADPMQREMLFHADGRTATVHASRLRASGTRILSTNGKPDGSLTATWFERCDTAAARRSFSGDDGTQALLALILLAHAPSARTGAVIGHGTGMSSHFLLGSPALTELTTIEIEPAMLAGSRVFAPANRRAFDDPRSRVVIDDAKSFFASAGRRFDLILSEPSNPWVSGVSGLFTTEFYSRLRSYLAPGAVFGQWLHTYELTDGLVQSVLAALHENFADYRIYLINGPDLLVVATPDGALRAPDWSVARSPAVQQDLCRFLPLTEAALARTLLIDRAGLAPLFAGESRANSDFYPVLDLGAERARFLQQSALGLSSLGAGVTDFLGDPSLRPAGFDTAATSIVAPGVRAMVLAAQVRRAGRDPAWSDGGGSSERYLYSVWDRQMASGAPPVNWRGWTADFWTIRRALHGGSAPADTAFFARARGYAEQAGAPAPVLAAVTLGEALAVGNLAGTGGLTETLISEARAGRAWIPTDDLLDASVRALLAAGQPDRARAAYDALRPMSARREGDLRLSLLNSYIEGASPRAP
jgi:spermidine synthase